MKKCTRVKVMERNEAEKLKRKQRRQNGGRKAETDKEKSQANKKTLKQGRRDRNGRSWTGAWRLLDGGTDWKNGTESISE